MESVTSVGGSNVSEIERWAAVVGGSVLAVYGITRRSPTGLLVAIMGGGLALRGIDGRAHVFEGLGLSRRHGESLSTIASASQETVRADRTITVRGPLAGLYRFWRKLEDLPRLIQHLDSVAPLGGNRLRWTIPVPMGGSVRWDAAVSDPIESPLGAIRRLEGSGHEHESTGFRDVGRETDVHMTLTYQPGPGRQGALIKRLLGLEPRRPTEETDHE